MMLVKILCMGMCCVVLSSCGHSGWRLKGNEFPPQVLPTATPEETIVQAPSTSSKVLMLRGVGVKTLFMIRVFIASFYLPSDVPSSDALEADVPKYLAVRFYAAFSSKDFVNFTVKHMKPNLSRQEFELLQPQLKELEKISPNIKQGDQLALSYQPKEGTSVILNGVAQGVIAGELFSKAIFSTWIGAKPFDHIVKRQILNIKNY